MIVLATVIGLAAVLSIWANRQALETDNWTETSSELLENEEVRDQISAFMVDTLFTNVDVQAELEQRLPPDLARLSGPAAGALRELAGRAADRALQSPRVQRLWEEANRAAHETLLKVVKDDSEEVVSLDLGPLIDQLGDRVGIDVASRLPEDAGQIEVLKPEELSAAQKVVNAIRGAALFLTLIALALWAGAVALARGWRREALRMVGIAFLTIGVVILAVRGLAGDVVVDSLASTAAVEPAIDETWTIATSMLGDGGQAMILYGIFILIAAWISGPGGAAVAARRELAPLLQRPGIAYVSLLVLLALLFWWAPTEGFKRVTISVLLIGFITLGWEALRRQTAREFPDETWERGSERWRGRLSRS